MAQFRRSEFFQIYARQPNRQKVAMRSFDQLLGLLSNIPDPRRAEGKLYGFNVSCCSRSRLLSSLAAIPVVPS